MQTNFQRSSRKNGESSRLPQNFVFSVQFFNFYYTFFLVSNHRIRHEIVWCRDGFFSLSNCYMLVIGYIEAERHQTVSVYTHNENNFTKKVSEPKKKNHADRQKLGVCDAHAIQKATEFVLNLFTNIKPEWRCGDDLVPNQRVNANERTKTRKRKKSNARSKRSPHSSTGI